MKEDKVVALISGGLDSTIALRFLTKKYDASNVFALNFYYGQKQHYENKCAANVCKRLGVALKFIPIPFLGEISKGYCSNTDPDIEVPNIKDVIGVPQPVTYVPNRNMILLSIAAAYAEVNGCNKIVTGFQIHDEYTYYDTTQRFVDSINSVLIQNRKCQIKVEAPQVRLSKTDEIKKLMQLDGHIDLLSETITCYNPKDEYLSCGVCQACSNRLQAFMNVGVQDPIPYVNKIY